MSPLLVPHLECLFHFQYINFQGWSTHCHGDRPVKGNVHASFIFWCNLVLVQDLHGLELVMDLHFVDCLIK